MKSAAVTLIAVLLLGPLAPTRALADAQSIADKTYDMIVLRPLGVFATALGGGFFIPAALMSAPNGRDGMRESWSVFVETPYDSTFDRPLGEF